MNEETEYENCILTCDSCDDKECKFRGDPYNINGDCLMLK